jgi:RecB family exonuclease
MPVVRSRNIFDPKSTKPFKLSRSRLDNFIQCPRCFYLDRRLGIDVPPMPGFTLNSAVDNLLKAEFDKYREKREAHPLMKEYGIKAVPFQHDDLPIWRNNFKGVQVHHQKTNLIITGAVDDVWQSIDNHLIVVDYKATSKAGEVELTDAPWHQAYRRQMEIYQWLLRGNGFNVLDTGYFVYANGIKDEAEFKDTLKFKTILLPYKGDSAWVEQTILDAYACLSSSEIPELNPNCEYCTYYSAIKEIE